LGSKKVVKLGGLLGLWLEPLRKLPGWRMAQSPVARLERSERGVTGAPWESLKHLGAEKMVWVVMIRCDEFSRKTRVLLGFSRVSG